MKKILINIIQRVLSRFGVRIAAISRIINSDSEFQEIYNMCAPFTMTSEERMYTLYRSVEYVIKNDIEGDFVECGVWKGGSAMLIAMYLVKHNVLDRTIYLYDTYEGMPIPTSEDFKVGGDDKNNASKNWVNKKRDDHNDWCYSPHSEVQNNLLSTGIDSQFVQLVKGKVEETIPQVVPKSIALLRLDTDWYESTKHELVHLYPLLIKRGVLIIDDYGYWAGTKKAVDEYFHKTEILLSPIDSSGVIGVKCT